MNVSIAHLRQLIEDGLRTKRWPRQAERLQAKSQGDYEFGGEVADHFVGRLDGQPAEAPLAALLPTLDDELWGMSYPHLFGYHTFFVANLLTAARIGELGVVTLEELTTADRHIVPSSLVVTGDVDAKHPLIVCGDLTVGGDFRAADSTVICGDVSVAGRWVGGDDFTSHAICGDATFGEALLIRGEHYVAGHTKAPGVFVNNPEYVGFLRSLDGLTSRICIECELDGFPRGQIDGAVAVDLAMPSALANRKTSPDEALRALRTLTDDAPEDAAAVRPFLDGWMARLFAGEPLRLKGP